MSAQIRVFKTKGDSVCSTLAEISVPLALYILVNFVIFPSFLIRTGESVVVFLLRQNDIAGSSAHKVISISDLTNMLYLLAFLFQNILDGSVTTHPTECEDDFPNIVECMAAGRYLYPAYYTI